MPEGLELILALLPIHAIERLEELHDVRKPFPEVFLHLFLLLVGQLQILLRDFAEHHERAAQVMRNLLARLLGDLLGRSLCADEAEEHKQTRSTFQSLHGSLSFSIEFLDPNILDVKFRDRLDFDAEQPRLVVGRVGIVVD